MRFPLALALLAVNAFAQEDMEAELKRFVSAYVAAEQNFADPIDPKTLFYQGAIPGMLRTLDPHSSFFDPDQFDQLKQMQQSEQKGFGTIVSVLPGRVIILQTLEGTPAAKAGLAAGDELLAVNGYDIRRLEIEQIIGLLGEARQREAALDVLKPGNRSEEHTSELQSH